MIYRTEKHGAGEGPIRILMAGSERRILTCSGIRLWEVYLARIIMGLTIPTAEAQMGRCGK